MASVDLTTKSATDTEQGDQIEGDYNGDNVVDISDYSQLLTRFGWLTSELPLELPGLDLNQDGVVDVVDYSLIHMNFGLAGVAPYN